MQETHDIFVRAHAPYFKKSDWRGKRRDKWPDFSLIFDTETRIDAAQKLTFACYRRCQLIKGVYRCIEEGLIRADDVSASEFAVLERYIRDPANVPKSERFPPQIKLKLHSRRSFITYVFWRAVKNGDLIVGFNLPFDLSRLAVKPTNGTKGSWSLVLSLREGRKSGKTEVNLDRPRIRITSINSKMAFFGLTSNLHRDEWPNEPRFLDLHTLTWGLRNESFSLDRACRAFGVPGKMDHKATGKVTPKEIKYCREDVAATNRLLNAAKVEFDQHPLDLFPDQTYSPASIAKAYLDKMEITHPKNHFKTANKFLGISMQAYYGGRAECRIRRTPVPVVLTDFTSQYPTVNALLGNWSVLKASGIRFENCKEHVKGLLSTVSLERAFEPSFWKELSFFALVKPENDILPVRTVYNGRTQNIGLNYLTSKEPIWYAGPDVVASTLLNQGKAPRVLKAVRLVKVGEQRCLSSTNLGGIVPIDPRKDDFFVRVIEQRNRLKRENKPLSDFLKVLGNSGSYGLFVQIDPETRAKPTKLRVYSGEKCLRQLSDYIEKPGPWYFPPVASLITAGGRLLLAMLERCVYEAGGEYLFCDTDSMCIVATENGGLVPCVGGKSKFDQSEAVQALSFEKVKSITKQFARLNPYDPTLVHEILKIEDVNYIDSDSSKPQRQLFGYGIAAKRYALYTQNHNSISVVKASGHGLGYLLGPRESGNCETENADDEDVPEWIVEAWDWLLRKELGSTSTEPKWLRLPAMMRITMSTPNVMRHNRPAWLAPFNFFLFPLISELDGYPAGYDKSNFDFIVPFESNRSRWKSLSGMNLRDGRTFRISMYPTRNHTTVVPESFGIILNKYLRHPEAKSLAPDGGSCVWNTTGLLKRSSILAGDIVPIGKETDRHWEQGDDPSQINFKVKEFRKKKKMVVADASDRKLWREAGLRYGMRKSGLSLNTVSDILNGLPVKQSTMAVFARAMEESTKQQ